MLQEYVDQNLDSPNDDMAQLVRYDLRQALRGSLDASIARAEKHFRKQELLSAHDLESEHRHIDVLLRLAKIAGADVSEESRRHGVILDYLEEMHQRFLDSLHARKKR